MKDYYEQVTVDLPPYIELLSQLPELSMKVTTLKEGKHVPSSSLSDGLKFIYQSTITQNP